MPKPVKIPNLHSESEVIQVYKSDEIDWQDSKDKVTGYEVEGRGGDNEVIDADEVVLTVVVLWLSLLHNFIQQSLNSGSAQLQALLALCRRFMMVRISDSGPGWK